MAFCEKVFVLLWTVVSGMGGGSHIVIQAGWLFIRLGVLYKRILILWERRSDR